MFVFDMKKPPQRTGCGGFLAEKEGFEACESVDIATRFTILRRHYDSLVIQQVNRPLQKLRHTDSLFVPVQRNPFCKLRFHLDSDLLIRLLIVALLDRRACMRLALSRLVHDTPFSCLFWYCVLEYIYHNRAAASTARRLASLVKSCLPLKQGFYFLFCFFDVLASIQDFKNHLQQCLKLIIRHLFFHGISFLAPATILSGAFLLTIIV